MKRHLSAKQLETMAIEAGCNTLTQNAITKVELGIRFVPDYEVGIFARILDTSAEYLLGLTDNPEPFHEPPENDRNDWQMFF